MYISDGQYFRFRDWLLEYNINLKVILDPIYSIMRAPSSVSGEINNPVSGRNNNTFVQGPEPSLNDSRISATITNNTSMQVIPSGVMHEDARLRKYLIIHNPL